MISEKLFCTTEGERVNKVKTIISTNKKSWLKIKAKELEFQAWNNPNSNSNVRIALNALEELEAQEKYLEGVIKNKWHPVPEISIQEIVFSKILNLPSNEER